MTVIGRLWNVLFGSRNSEEPEPEPKPRPVPQPKPKPESESESQSEPGPPNPEDMSFESELKRHLPSLTPEHLEVLRKLLMAAKGIQSDMESDLTASAREWGDFVDQVVHRSPPFPGRLQQDVMCYAISMRSGFGPRGGSSTGAWGVADMCEVLERELENAGVNMRS